MDEEDSNLRIEEQEPIDRVQDRDYEIAVVTTGMFFLLFIMPILLMALGSPINLYLALHAPIHEAGHFIFNILSAGNRIIAVAGGTFFSYLLPVLGVVIFANVKRGAAVAMIFLACIGSVMPHDAWYIESASHPYVRAYLTLQTTSPETHDWYILLSHYGLLGKEYEIGRYVRTFGDVFLLVGTIGSVLGFGLLLNRSSIGFSGLMLMAGIPSAVYFLIRMNWTQLAITLVLLFLAAAWLVLRNRKNLNGWKKQFSTQPE